MLFQFGLHLLSALFLPVALAAADLGPPTAEIGGVVQVPVKVPLSLEAEVQVYTDDLCLTATRTDEEGRYLLRLDPGEYTLRVMHADEEVATRRVSLQPGSWHLDIDARLPVIEMPPQRLLTSIPGTRTSRG